MTPQPTPAEPEIAIHRPYTLAHRLFQPVLAFVLRAFFRLYGRWRIIGRENIPKSGAVLLAANHASYLDPPLGWAAVYGTRRMWGVARADLWKGKLMTFIMDSFDSLPVKRGSGDRALLRRVLELLGEGKMVGIFPEGTRTFDGKLNPAQPGIALMVQKTGAPVVPVAIMGAYEMLPRGAKKLRRVPLKVIFGEPLRFEKTADRDLITTQIMAAIAQLMTAHGTPTDAPAPERAALLKEQEQE
jgi:1-acyl-sn-glycerol-3-phosphate acyltransferase